MKLLTLLIALMALAGPVGLLITHPGDDFGVDWDKHSDRVVASHPTAKPMRLAIR